MSTDISTLRQRGFSLIELIIFIVVISVALTGILMVMNTVTRHSADPLIHKQAIAAAESLLEEIQLQDFIDLNNGLAICPPASVVTPTNRSTDYHIVSCYNGYPNGGPAPGIYALDGTPVAGLENYSATVAIVPSALGAIAAGSAVLITVTVTEPQGGQVAISGYRTQY